MFDDTDPLIAELRQTQRDRRILVAAAVIGIVASAALGMAFGLGALGTLGHGAAGARNPGAIVFFVAPFFVCYGLGHLAHAIVRWSRGRATAELDPRE